MLMGLLDPSEGQILVDGVNLAQDDRQWRSQIAYMPQDVFLLHDSIATNLRIGKADASDEELWNALDADATEVVVSFEDRCGRAETVLGSGGHRKRSAMCMPITTVAGAMMSSQAAATAHSICRW
jgi:ABC-type multidrug transport system fused ATPase/permease subunit